MTAIRLVLPFPPSLNHYWRRNGGHGMHISEAGKAYRVAVQDEVRKSHRGVRLTGRLDVTLGLTMPNHIRRDIDNFAKVALDAITKTGLWEDDSQLDRLEIVRLGAKSPGGAELLVRECERVGADAQGDPGMPGDVTPTQQVARFNIEHPPGTRVRYWPGLREGDGLIGMTRGPAFVLEGHTAVVWVEEYRNAGCIALSHVQAIPAD